MPRSKPATISGEQGETVSGDGLERERLTGASPGSTMGHDVVHASFQAPKRLPLGGRFLLRLQVVPLGNTGITSRMVVECGT